MPFYLRKVSILFFPDEKLPNHLFMISIIHPSRGRPEKSVATIDKWISMADNPIEIWASLDEDDLKLYEYQKHYHEPIIGHNKTAVEAINRAAGYSHHQSTSDIFVVVSDDTDCFPSWDTALLKAVEGKEDYLLKTKDGIQDYIVTMTVMDREYYRRDEYIYHPDFKHQFADTYLTCVADIRGRLIKSDLEFKHNHYSVLKETPDALHKRNDDTWKEGQKTFVKLMKEFTPEERARIKDKSMWGFLRKFGL